jgi:hypothetical protein
MFYKHKYLFFIIQFIFCSILAYFINQQIILVGLLKNLFVDSLIIYLLLIFISSFLSKIITQIYILSMKMIRAKFYRRFFYWFCFTILCYTATFIIFAISIEY